MYDVMNCSNAVDKLDIPTLMISARNDPTNRHDLIPWDKIRKNPNIIYIYTQKGGHLEFMSDLFRNRWYKFPMSQFLFNLDKMHKNNELEID